MPLNCEVWATVECGCDFQLTLNLVSVLLLKSLLTLVVSVVVNIAYVSLLLDGIFVIFSACFFW